MASIETAVSWAVQIANDDTHGYSQVNRNGPDYDCSSFVSTALYMGGFDIATTNNTNTLYKALTSCGFEAITDTTRKRGDIFLTPGKHVVLCVDASNIVHASQDENGGITGSTSGDQTGKEICVRTFYTPSYGWTYHMRLKSSTTTTTSSTTTSSTSPSGIVATAYAVIRGEYGNGDARVAALEAEGWTYGTVQAIVNYIYTYGDEFIDVVYNTIAGVYGNGDARKTALTEAGYDYDKVQFAVNAVLKYG